MTEETLRDLYGETRRLEVENKMMEEKLEQNRKSKEFQVVLEVMETSKQQEMKNEIQFKRDNITGILENIKEEEQKGKDSLDAKVKVVKEHQVQKYDLGILKERFQTNYDDLIKQKDRESKLIALKAKLEGETEDLTAKNTEYEKKNDDFRAENEELEKKIQ